MPLLDMFDKLDDILYKPVDAICDWAKEPLRGMQAKRDLQAERVHEEIELHREAEMLRLRQIDEAKRAELEQARARADLELDNLAADSQLARNTAMVEAIKQYKIDLANVTQEINQNIGMMNLEMRSRASDMLLAKTRDYKALQEEATEKAFKRLSEIKELFGDNERVRIRMEDAVMDQMTSIIGHANKFMEQLSSDLQKINDTIQLLTQKGMDSLNEFTDSMKNPTALPNGNQRLIKS